MWHRFRSLTDQFDPWTDHHKSRGEDRFTIGHYPDHNTDKLASNRCEASLTAFCGYLFCR